jgi:hypothetical protein
MSLYHLNNALDNVRCLSTKDIRTKCEIICHKSSKMYTRCKQSGILTSLQYT